MAQLSSSFYSYRVVSHQSWKELKVGWLRLMRGVWWGERQKLIHTKEWKNSCMIKVNQRTKGELCPREVQGFHVSKKQWKNGSLGAIKTQWGSFPTAPLSYIQDIPSSSDFPCISSDAFCWTHTVRIMWLHWIKWAAVKSLSHADSAVLSRTLHIRERSYRGKGGGIRL